MASHRTISFFFFFNDTATTEIYTLSLHDALPISRARRKTRSEPCLGSNHNSAPPGEVNRIVQNMIGRDRKSTRLNSSHLVISYAVFCLKKKKKNSKAGGSLKTTTRYPLSSSHVTT